MFIVKMLTHHVEYNTVTGWLQVNRRLHICLLSAGRVFANAYGGEEVFTISLGNWLVKEGYDVSLMGIDLAGLKSKLLHDSHKNRQPADDFATTIRNNNNKNVPIKNDSDVENSNNNKITKPDKINKFKFRHLLYSLRLFIWIFQVIRIVSINLKKPVTLIHAQDAGYTGLAAVVSGRLLGIPVIISLHSLRYRVVELEPSIPKLLKKAVLKLERSLDVFTIKNANNIMVVNSSLEEYCKQITDKKIYYFTPAIKSNNFEFSENKRDTIRKELGLDRESKVIGYVGRLSPEKNLLNFLVSFTKLVNDDPLIKLVIVGRGPMESELKKFVSENNIEDKVIFCGVRSDIGSILSSLDIFILPSYTEGLSTALLEAMTCGRAIVCSDIPGNREVLTNNKEALLVNPYDLESLKSAILLLCNDISLQSKLGNNAKMKASQYNEDAAFGSILKYYQELVA
jgi:glycosyltransferase involved in cell wall biosynthesis